MNLAKANCRGNRVCTSCDIVVLGNRRNTLTRAEARKEISILFTSKEINDQSKLDVFIVISYGLNLYTFLPFYGNPAVQFILQTSKGRRELLQFHALRSLVCHHRATLWQYPSCDLNGREKGRKRNDRWTKLVGEEIELTL